MLAGFARWIGFLTMAAGTTGALLLAGGFAGSSGTGARS